MLTDVKIKYIGEKDTAITLLQDIYALELDILPVGSGEIEKMMELAVKYKNKNIALRDIVHASVMLTSNIKK